MAHELQPVSISIADASSGYPIWSGIIIYTTYLFPDPRH